MTLELKLLALSIVIGLVQIVLASHAASLQRGYVWTSLRPGEPVTIGSPFANVTYVILAVDELRPLPHGEVGELCIGGCTSRAFTATCRSSRAEKFIAHPQCGRLYRTGDKCKIGIQTQRVHLLGRLDTQLKVRGHRVDTQAVEGILQTQFSEIEAAVVDYQNEALVAFVAAPSVCEGAISVVARAPAAWAARVTATLAKQLPEPSVPTRILLVEKFVMNPVSGKIDRKSLPNLSHLLRSAERKAEDARRETLFSGRDTGEGEVEPPDADAGMDPENEEVLAICRAASAAYRWANEGGGLSLHEHNLHRRASTVGTGQLIGVQGVIM